MVKQFNTKVIYIRKTCFDTQDRCHTSRTRGKNATFLWQTDELNININRQYIFKLLHEEVVP